jgi:hypothetical protein
VLGEDERNSAVTRLLQKSNEKCDRVIRTLFAGTEFGLDEWEALCHDRNSCSFIVLPDLSARIELVHCRDLQAAAKMLLPQGWQQEQGCRVQAQMSSGLSLECPRRFPAPDTCSLGRCRGA